MSLDPHFEKTVLALHFEGVEDPAYASFTLGLRSDPALGSKASGSVWKSTDVIGESVAGRAALRLQTTASYYGLYTATASIFNGLFTFECWVYSTTASFSIAGAINGATIQHSQFYVSYTGTALRVSLRGTYADTTVAFPLNEWVHVAVACDGTNWHAYINGVRIKSYGRGASSYTHNGIRVGSNGVTTGFVGYVSDFRVYVGVCKYLADTFVPEWPYPQFGLHRDSGYAPSTVTATGSALTPHTGDSKFGGGCLYLDGASYAECPASADWNFGTGDFTVEAWVKRSAGGVWQAIVGQWNNTTDKSWSMYVGPSNDLAFFTKDATFDHYTGTGGSAQLPAGEWVHCAASRQGDTLRLFLNGELKATNTSFAGYAVGVSGTVLRIGRAVAVTDPFTGYIDDVRITKGVARYTENFTPPAQAFPDGQAVVSGVIYDSEGNLCSRRVFVHSRATGRLLGTALSDPATGVYEIAAEEECYVVCLDSTGNYNAKIIDGVDPTT